MGAIADFSCGGWCGGLGGVVWCGDGVGVGVVGWGYEIKVGVNEINVYFYDMVIQCKECGKVLEQIKGKRKREFCGSTCRSNFWQKLKRKIAANNEPEVKARILKTRATKPTTPITKNPLTPDDTTPPPKGDPKEGSMAFFMKYDCYTYEELKNKK